jgi:DNA-binding response OmpR family regulator
MRALDILVVDDEHDLASGIVEMLESEGHRVAVASSGEAAIEEARAHTFDMVFLDIKLPGMTGIDALCELRKTQARARVVLMTGYRIDSLLGAFAKAGGLTVLNGPVAAPRISKHLREVGPGGIVLLVSEDSGLGPHLKNSLAEQGTTVRLAASEAEAIESAKLSGLEAVILDLHRPVACALETYLALQNLAPAVAAVIVARPPTGGSSAANPLRSIAVTGCLFKPFDPAELLRAVQEHAAVPAAQGQGTADPAASTMGG